MLHHLRDVRRSAPWLLFVLLASPFYAASSKLDEFLRLFLRQDSGEAFFSAFARNFDFFGAIGRCLSFALLGVAFAIAAAALAARFSRRSFDDLLTALAPAYATLLVPVLLSLLGVVSVTLSPLYPYGLGLALSLGLEGSFASLLTAGLFCAALLHGLAGATGPWEIRARRGLFPVAVVMASLVGFTVATPSEFYRDGSGQGNMFKYLRMASSVAGSGTLDIERAPESEDVTFSSFLALVPGMARSYLRETRVLFGRILGSALRGELYTGEPSASRANRSMFRSDEGGIFYINAPGPGLLLVPAYLLDRSLNRAFGTDLQLAAIAFWQLIGALLVYETFRAASDVAGRSAALVTAFAMAVAVPVLFYTFQIYPELPAALLLLCAFRRLVLDPLPSRLGIFSAALALGALPWLHQKYSVVAAVLGLWGLSRLVRRERRGVVVEWGSLALFVVPLVVSAYSVFLYNHALTGSLSPTATFAAADRSSFEPRGFPRGLLGLFFDRENGLFVFAPLYLLALVGAKRFTERHDRLVRPLLLVVAAYLVVIASFPYWPGAVSTMGRYVLSVVPFFALPAALVVRRAFSDGVVAGCAITLAAASLAMSASFVRDLGPSYQPALLWDRVLYSDPEQYLPTFLTEGFLGSGPAHTPKLLAQLLVVALLVVALSGRVWSEVFPREFSVRATLSASALLLGLVLVGALLEHFPGNPAKGGKPAFRETREIGSGGELSVVEGEHGYEGEGVWVPGGGSTRFLLLAPRSLRELTISFRNGPEENTVEMEERGGYETTLELPGGGPHERKVLLRKPYRFDGPRGERFLYELTIRSRGSFVPADAGESDDRRRLGTYVRVP